MNRYRYQYRRVGEERRIEFWTHVHAQMPDERVAEAAAESWLETRRWNDDEWPDGTVMLFEILNPRDPRPMQFAVSLYVKHEFCATRREQYEHDPVKHGPGHDIR